MRERWSSGRDSSSSSWERMWPTMTAIIAAPIVDIYGSASSGLAAQDLHQKLRRIGHQANAWTDAHLALTSAAVLVVTPVSSSGVQVQAVGSAR